MAATLKSLPLSPLFTGSALYLLTRAPPHIQRPVLDKLLSVISPPNVARLVTALKWLFAAGLIKNINNYLNQWAGNDFTLFSSTQGWDWQNEIAVVTGGSSGFGALFAKDLSAKGIHVVVLDINELPAHLQNNPKISFYKCNVTDQDAVLEVGRKIEAEIGNPSILINNAGIGAGKTILETSSKFLDKIFGVNLFSHYYTVQAFLPDMIKKRKGQVISIASMASFVSTGYIVDYSATKVGALAFHEGLRSELRTVYKCPEIKTTVVHPIWADTPLIAEGKDHLTKSGQIIIQPQTVSDAVVKQILSCKSGQIILAGNSTVETIVSSMRGFPTWIQEFFKKSAEMAPPEIGQINLKETK